MPLTARMYWLILLAALAYCPPGYAESEYEKIFKLSFEELANISVFSTSTLTVTSARQAPAAITIITHEDIRLSGASNLDELLDIYVPEFQVMKKDQSDMIGIRGIISDRNNKMLIIVNGRNMNIKTRDAGAFSERNLSMLGDIKKISVIRGSDSAVYEPGAIASIINIETFNSDDFEGIEFAARAGAFENFVNAEIKYGKKLNEDMGFFRERLYIQ